jgi:serine/threonine protein kinase
MNLKSEELLLTEPWRLTRSPNLGFVFKTNGSAIEALKRKYDPFQPSCPNLSSELPVVVKYLSALLDPRYIETLATVNAMLEILKYSATDLAENVVHPYMGVLELQALNMLVVMHDMGETLYDLVYTACSEFRSRWQKSPALRANFFTRVGMSALNLVWRCKLCHNDIRLPNIALRGDSFALIDFDMARASLQLQPNSAFSPPLQLQYRVQEGALCYSVAQIAVNVFILDAPSLLQLSDVQEATCIWKPERTKSSHVDCAFEDWVINKGSVLQSFIACVREACYPTSSSRVSTFPPDYKLYFEEVLRCMLL